MENCNNIIVINLGGVEIYYECADMQNRQISQIVCADSAIPQYRRDKACLVCTCNHIIEKNKADAAIYCRYAVNRQLSYQQINSI